MTDWPFPPPIDPMEARVREELPGPTGWAYEPKWDGFRCLAWGGDEIRLDSRQQKPLLRYFPELRDAVNAVPDGTVVDGEVIVAVDGALDFDALQQRIHPAESRINKLAKETPAALVAFDLLADRGEDLRGLGFGERRERLAALAPQLPAPWHLTPSTTDIEQGQRWFTEFESAGCDGIVAKRLEAAYIQGKREMVKVKHRRDADVVIGGYRVHKDGGKIGSLLLGLYNPEGQLHFIGHCSGFGDADRTALLARLEPLIDAASFGGGASEEPSAVRPAERMAAAGAPEVAGEVRVPGGISRWSGDKDLSWVPVRPELVCEISYDQLTGGRFRHATRFERWRPDKSPEECTFEQLERPEGPGFEAIVAAP